MKHEEIADEKEVIDKPAVIKNKPIGNKQEGSRLHSAPFREESPLERN